MSDGAHWRVHPTTETAGRDDAAHRTAALADIVYIRGGGGAVVDGRRLAAVVVAVCSVVLAVLVLLLTGSAIAQESRAAGLRAHSVAVDVAVTSCMGLASGTGITTTGSTCRGTFTLNGRRYNEVLRGSTAPHDVGDVVAAVVLPGHPASLSTKTSVYTYRSPWRPFLTPGILLLVNAAVVLAGRVRRAHNRVRSPAR